MSLGRSDSIRLAAALHPSSSPKLLSLGFKFLKRRFSSDGTEADAKPLLSEEHKSAIEDDCQFNLDQHLKKMRWSHRAPFPSAAFARKFHLVPVGEPMPFDILCGYMQETPDEKDAVELEQRWESAAIMAEDLDESDAVQAHFKKSVSSYDAPLTPKLFFDGGRDYYFCTSNDNILPHKNPASPLDHMVDPLDVESEQAPTVSESTTLQLQQPTTSGPNETLSASTINLNSETKETTTSRGAQLAIFNNSKTSLPSTLDPKTETASSQTTLPIAYNSGRTAFNADGEEILLPLTYNPKGKTVIDQVSPLAAYSTNGREILLPLTYSPNSETIAGNFLESNITNRGLPVLGGETVPPFDNLHGHPSRVELAEQGANGYPHQAQIESSAFSDEDEVTLGGSNPSSVRLLRNPDKAKADP
jgi:hypothetical protein